MTPEDFISAFYEQGNIVGGGIVIDQDIVISDNSRYPQASVFGGEMVISNIVFNGKLNFQNLHIRGSIKFQNCSFNQGVSFHKLSNSTKDNGVYLRLEIISSSAQSISFGHCCDIDEISVNYNLHIGNLTINNNKIDSLLILGNKQLEHLWMFKNVAETIAISNNDSSVRYIFHDESNERIEIKNNHLSSFIEIKNLEARKKLELSYNQMEYSEFLGKLDIGELEIFDNKTNRFLSINLEDDSCISSLSCSLGNYGQGLSVSAKSYNHKIQSIAHHSNECTLGPYNFYNLNVARFMITGLVQNSTIFVHHCYLNELTFRNLTNNGLISLTNLSSNSSALSEVNIDNSNLGEIELRKVDFSMCTEVKITSSSLVGIKSTHTKWFQPKVLNTNHLWGLDKHYENKEVYRQLKQAMYSQGNTIQALTFKSLEMEEYHESIKLERPLKEIDSLREFGDRLSIYLNRASNKNGLDWTRPIGLLLGVTFFTYFFVIIHGSYQLGWTPARSCEELMTTLTTLSDNFGIYFRLMDPTLKLSEVVGTFDGFRIGRLLTVIYFAYKIVLAYLIFQTIAAFRKYLK